MPYKEKHIEKVYWTTGAVAHAFGVKPSCIRFWLEEFGIKPRRNSNNWRKLNQHEVATLLKIKNLKDEGYTLWGIKKKLYGNLINEL